MLVTVVVHLKGYYEETSPARRSHHQIEEDDKMKINHVWPLLISINPIWRPIRVTILNFLAGITPNEPEDG